MTNDLWWILVYALFQYILLNRYRVTKRDPYPQTNSWIYDTVSQKHQLFSLLYFEITDGGHIYPKFILVLTHVESQTFQ